MPLIMKSRIIQMLLLGVLVIVTMLISLTYGSKDIGFATVMDVMKQYDQENMDHLIIMTSRLPRVTGALLIGAFLAVSGAMMQGMTRNYLASPSIMGVSDGSVFVITLCMIFLPNAAPMTLILYSLIGSFLGAFMVFGIARLLPDGMTPITLAILGTIIECF